ncbi:MAG: GNAT family N-acetyltransferase [Ardenticatenaceae bacterium]|nr:GNAT family N-acetyltransferase [Ardenticatenaceae bacterium]
MIETRHVTTERLDDLADLFCTNRYTEKCWCMWHIISVKAFHAGGSAGNRAKLAEIAQTEDLPVGILAYQDGEPIGWCAVGPRERYKRALTTPSYKIDFKESYQNVWLVPCFLSRSDKRGMGLSRLLLEAAVQLAQEHKAEAIDGFPFASGKRRSSSQIHVGFESTFVACGFAPISRPSGSRVIMRRVILR